MYRVYNQSKGTQPQGVALNVVLNGEERSFYSTATLCLTTSVRYNYMYNHL